MAQTSVCDSARGAPRQTMGEAVHWLVTLKFARGESRHEVSTTCVSGCVHSNLLMLSHPPTATDPSPNRITGHD